MKIIHYIFGLPPVRTGGLLRYALDLISEQAKMGHEVSILIPGVIASDYPDNIKISKWKKQKGIPCYRIKNPVYIPNAYGINRPSAFMPAVSVEVYGNWLKKLQPDVIHIHSLLGLHREFFQAANELHIPMVFTTHDYFGLCPKIDYLKGNENCKSEDWGDCIGCSRNAYELRRLKLEQSEIYRRYCGTRFLMNLVHGKAAAQIKNLLKPAHRRNIEENAEEERNKNGAAAETPSNNDKKLLEEYRSLQQYYRDIFQRIDYYHFNSSQTRSVFEACLGEKHGRVIPVINSSICDKRRKKKFGKMLRIGYLGTQMPMKGYYYLLQELDEVYQSGRQDFCLNTYLTESRETRGYIRNRKPFTPKQQEEVYGAMDLLVVPSLWRETFGMVVLEAISYGVPVLVSEHVGAKMLIEEHWHCGQIFEASEGKLAGIVKEIYDDRKKLEDMNRCILESKIALDYRGHVEEICEMYMEMKSGTIS